MDFTAGPRRKQIADGLVQLRKRAKLSQEETATRAGVSKATVSRYEDWRNRQRIRWPVVKDLCEACGASEQETATLVQLTRDTTDGWWVGNTAVPDWLNPLVSLEAESPCEYSFAISLVPGLLQTADYARAINQAEEVRVPADVIEGRVDARMKRQSVLTERVPPLHLWVVLDQAVLARMVGSADIMAAQMDHLLAQGEQPNIDIQVLPFDAGASAAGISHFIALGGVADLMQVVYIETLAGGLYLDGEKEITRYTLAWDYLRSQAASTSASAKLLASALKEYRK